MNTQGTYKKLFQYEVKMPTDVRYPRESGFRNARNARNVLFSLAACIATYQSLESRSCPPYCQCLLECPL